MYMCPTEDSIIESPKQGNQSGFFVLNMPFRPQEMNVQYQRRNITKQETSPLQTKQPSTYKKTFVQRTYLKGQAQSKLEMSTISYKNDAPQAQSRNQLVKKLN